MKYLEKSFTVPACNPLTEDDRWAMAFGYKNYAEYETARKKKMKKAIAEQEKRGKTPIPRKCGGGAGVGKVQA